MSCFQGHHDGAIGGGVDSRGVVECDERGALRDVDVFDVRVVPVAVGGQGGAGGEGDEGFADLGGGGGGERGEGEGCGVGGWAAEGGFVGRGCEGWHVGRAVGTVRGWCCGCWLGVRARILFVGEWMGGREDRSAVGSSHEWSKGAEIE